MKTHLTINNYINIDLHKATDNTVIHNFMHGEDSFNIKEGIYVYLRVRGALDRGQTSTFNSSG